MKKILLLPFTLFFTLSLQAQIDIDLELFASGFNSPVAIENAGDERLFIVEQRGKIKIIDGSGTSLSTPFLDLTLEVSQTGDERGLLGLVFHPDYENNGYFYVNYTEGFAGTTKIMRFQVSQSNPNVADPNSGLELMSVSQPFTNHNAGDLNFGPDGYLYFGLGDGGSANDPGNRAQDRQNLLGKMIRIDVDNGNPYAIPNDNPFVNDANTLDEIWAIGLRNPWKFSFDACTDDMWLPDVGQDDWEEINFEPAGSDGGLNYGWRCYEGDHAFNTSGCGPMSDYTFPIFEYANSGSSGCSVTGGFVYRGAQFGEMFGHYLHTDYCSGNFWSTVPDGSGGWNTTLLEQFSQFEYVAFGEDQFNELYVSGRDNGNIYHITEATCLPTAFIKNGEVNLCEGDTVKLQTIEGENLIYQWKKDGVNIAGANDATYATAEAGDYSVEVTNLSVCSNADTVTVSVFPVPAQPTLSGLSATYCDTDNPVTLTGNPSGGTFSGPGVSGNTFDPGAAGGGNHEIIYTITENGCPNSDTADVEVEICPGLHEISSIDELNLFPNPTAGNLNISIRSSEKLEAVIQVHDLTGRIVFEKSMWLTTGNQLHSLDLSGLGSGVYNFTLQSDEGKMHRKIILNH